MDCMLSNWEILKTFMNFKYYESQCSLYRSFYVLDTINLQWAFFCHNEGKIKEQRYGDYFRKPVSI